MKENSFEKKVGLSPSEQDTLDQFIDRGMKLGDCTLNIIISLSKKFSWVDKAGIEVSDEKITPEMKVVQELVERSGMREKMIEQIKGHGKQKVDKDREVEGIRQSIKGALETDKHNTVDKLSN